MAETINWLSVMRTPVAPASNDEIIFADAPSSELLATVTVPASQVAIDLLVRYGVPVWQQDGDGRINRSLLSTGLLPLQSPHDKDGGLVVPVISVRILDESISPDTSLFSDLNQARTGRTAGARAAAKARAVDILCQIPGFRVEFGVAANDPELVDGAHAWRWREKCLESYDWQQLPVHEPQVGERHITDNPDVACWFEPPVAFTQPLDEQHSRLAVPSQLVSDMLVAAQEPLRMDARFRRSNPTAAR